MAESLTVVVSGCVSVFIGMGFLYLAIKATAYVVDRLPVKEEPHES